VSGLGEGGQEAVEVLLDRVAAGGARQRLSAGWGCDLVREVTHGDQAPRRGKQIGGDRAGHQQGSR
jgi:hypothetical protein